MAAGNLREEPSKDDTITTMAAKRTAPQTGPNWYGAAVVLTVLCGTWAGHWAASTVALIGYVLLPGFAILAAARWRDTHASLHVAAAGACGLILMMLIGAAVSWAGPWVGIERGLDRGVQLWIYAVVLVACAYMERRRGGWLPTIKHVSGGRSARRAAYATLLPLLALVGATKLNRGNGNDLALAAMLGAWAMLTCAVVASGGKRAERREGGIVAGLFGAALSITWGSSLRGQWLSGWDLQKEYGVAAATARAGRWSTEAAGDAYNAMLSITALPAQLSSLTGIDIATILRGVYPVLLAAIVPVSYLALRRFVHTRAAVTTVVLLILAARAWPQQLPAVARQEVALYLFTVAIAVIAGSGAVRSRKLLAGGLLGAIAFTHYTSSYATAFMCLVAAGAGMLDRKRPEAKGRILTLPVAAAVVIASLGWNLFVVGNASFYDEPARGVEREGLQILENRGEREGVMQRWLQGTGTRYASVEEYAEVLEAATENELSWLRPDPNLVGDVATSAAPIHKGPLAAWNPAWNLATTGAYQGLVLLTVLAVAWTMWRNRRRTGTDLFGMLLAAFALNVLLRVSSSAATFYNPERGALHSGIVLCFALAPFIERMAEKYKLVALASIALAGVLTYSTWGLGTMTFAGKPRAAVANYGEDVERFVYSRAERRAAEWLAENVEEGLVQSDRYGRVLLTGIPEATYGNVDIVHPSYIDERAWVFATRTNIVEGRARGYLAKIFSVYQFPTDRLEQGRAIVHATEYSRIYR